MTNKSRVATSGHGGGDRGNRPLWLRQAGCYATSMILLRHGQSEFNLHFSETRRDPGIVDPRLTDLGHAQAQAAAQALGAKRALAAERIERIVVSPYTRTLQTAAPVAEVLGLPLIVEPLVRERFAFACDIGSPRSELERNWPQHNFSKIEDIWWPAQEEPEDSIVDRASRFRATLAGRHDWQHTLVISHWGFILSMTGQSVTNGQWLRCDPTEPAPERLVWRA
jgi:broad specificity phosphatase PhoE